MKRHFACISLLLITVLLIACSPNSQPGAVTPTPAQATVVQGESTATIEPSATPEPGKALLVGVDNSDLKAIQPVLAELASGAGMTVETRPTIQPADLTPAIKAVLMMDAPGNLNDLLAAAPQTQFIAITQVDMAPASNLTQIRIKPEDQAFVGGFISVLLSTDYRAAGLLPSDGPLGDQLKDAFTNGGRYFCGVCAPGWPLSVYYPIAISLPAATDGPAWERAAADAFDNQKVETYYLTDEALRPEVINSLQGKIQFESTILLVGSMPPPESLKAQWAATIHFDLPAALRQAWPDAMAGKGGIFVAPLLVDEINAQNLGPGRQRLVNELLEELKAGRIYPFSVPLQ